MGINQIKTLADLKIKIFADGADKAGILALNANPIIKGITTNPTLMRKAGVKNYEAFTREILEVVKEKPVSFEVLSDQFDEMKRQALKIAGWAQNIYVKIPITNARGESSLPLVRELSGQGVKLNVTAILTSEQIWWTSQALNKKVQAVISVFAGRIADTGIDPVPVLRNASRMLSTRPQIELLWASVREVFNIFQAEECGCHIVTVPHDILTKAMKLVETPLPQMSLDTVKMFRDDAIAAGFTL